MRTTRLYAVTLTFPIMNNRTGRTCLFFPVRATGPVAAFRKVTKFAGKVVKQYGMKGTRGVCMVFNKDRLRVGTYCDSTKYFSACAIVPDAYVVLMMIGD